ncbi:MAG: alginate export family protein [Bacteroidetes bacterium]|nr:alginate export family protein [Bacteroidota bacterium]
MTVALLVVPAVAQDNGADTDDVGREAMAPDEDEVVPGADEQQREDLDKRGDIVAGDEPAQDVDPAAAFITRTKNPVSWFSWGADQRIREVYIKNPFLFNNDTRDPGSGIQPGPGGEWHYQRFRTRLWGKAKMTDDMDVNARLVWEFRHWCKPDGRLESVGSGDDGFDADEALFDHLNVQWRNALGLPLTVTVGRQDIIIGNGWLVLDGTPLDGSRTIYFDAVRLQYDINPIQTNVDVSYIEQGAAADKHMEPFNDRERYVTEQDERGVILNVVNRSIENHELGGYFIWKQMDARADNGNDGTLYTIGLRGAGTCGDRWTYRTEMAAQTGHKNANRLCAFGTNNRLTYKFNDPLKSEVRVAYEFLSGDQNATHGKDEGFDILWGRWPQFSELYAYSAAAENRLADATNVHRLGFGWSFHPHAKLDVCTDYHLLWANHNPLGGATGFSGDGMFRGQIVTLLLRYAFTEQIKGHLVGEAFFPGNYYDNTRNDPAVFARYEITFAW